MERSIFFLRTKLLPPRAVSDLLARPRLTEKLRANLTSPMTMVAADAGCGKTTLIADFIRNQQRPTVWYQLDHTDADPIVFLGYVAEGIRNIVPSFGKALFPYLSDTSEEFLRYPERAVDLLINEILQSVEQPLILVLDDYHHIGRDTVVHRLVDRLIQYSSDLLHLIITTRDIPPLAITRRRTQSAALVLTRDDLLFTDDEVRELFRKTINLELRDDQIAEYRQRTHGWITALQLVRQVAEQEMDSSDTSTAIDLSEILQQSEHDIFDYFAEEVFSREPAETQKLLLLLSLLETLPLDLCSKLFPDTRCSAALPELAQKNVFLTVASDGTSAEEYRFHPLFRDFLLRRLRADIGSVAMNKERNRIAVYFGTQKQWELAVQYLLQAENYPAAAQIVAEQGQAWISAGAFTSLGLFAGQIPDEILEQFPRAILHTAEVARLQGETETSLRLLTRSVKLLQDQGDDAGEAEALHSMASLARRRGRTDEALSLLAKAETLAPISSETYLKCANTRGLCLITQGNWTEAEQQFRMALELAEKLSNEHYIRLVTHNLALAPGFRGDFGEALRWFKRIFRDDQPDKQLPQEAIGHLNVARLHLYRGEFAETETHLQRALELCQLYNLKFLRGEIFEAYGNFYRDSGDRPHAEEFYERALKAYDEAEVDIYAKELLEERAKFLRLQGKTQKARALLDSLLDARRNRDGGSGSKTVELGVAQIDLAEGKFDGLADRIGALLEFFHVNNHHYDEALAAMVLAELYFKLGQRSQMAAATARVLDLAARFDYEFWLRSEIRRNPEIFRHEEIEPRLPGDLRSELVDVAETAVAAQAVVVPATVQTPLTDLTINVLGPVEIFRDAAKPFAADAWTTRRARDILCCIATSKHRRTAKDTLIDTFWPDDDIETVEKNFHPTISHIRKALNSRQSYKQNFIVFRDGSYQLNPELSYTIDSEEFERRVTEAEAAKRDKDPKALRIALEAAYKLYRGDFMSGVYDSWAQERRIFYVEQYARVTTALAKLSFSEKKWAAATRYATEALKDDPYREDIHRLVLKTLAAQGKTQAVKHHFEELSALLERDLGIEPATETKRLYHELRTA